MQRQYPKTGLDRAPGYLGRSFAFQARSSATPPMVIPMAENVRKGRLFPLRARNYGA